MLSHATDRKNNAVKNKHLFSANPEVPFIRKQTLTSLNQGSENDPSGLSGLIFLHIAFFDSFMQLVEYIVAVLEKSNIAINEKCPVCMC